MIRIFSIVFFTSLFGSAFSQANLPLSNDVIYSWSEHLEKLDVNFHTSVKPYISTEFNATKPVSVFSGSTNHYWSGNPQFKSFSSDSVSTGHRFYAQPIFRSSFGLDTKSDTSYSFLGGGAAITYSFENQFAANFSFYTDNSSYPSYLNPIIDSSGVIPSFGLAHPTSRGYSFTNVFGYASWSPHRYFHFQGGFGKHFIGDGYRSLLLSDNAYNYPYLKLSTSFWRVKYMVLYSMMQNIQTDPGNPSGYLRKFSTTHYLDWNISRRVSLGIFETVVWQARDSLLNRQFDVNYLNPFVFFRPVEYGQGSADNVLLGLNLKVNITDHYLLYGQMILDEFLLKEIRADSGWWANKYGFQIGAKAFSPFGIDRLQLQTEFNIVRPFTYTHRSVTQNYGHFGEALAHPLGANFKESVSFVRYSWKRFQLEEQFNWAEYGIDTNARSYGGNIFKSYSSRAQDYHNYYAQGLKNTLLYNDLRLSYVLSPSWNLRLWVSHVYRRVSNEYGTEEMNFIRLGISSFLWNQYLDR